MTGSHFLPRFMNTRACFAPAVTFTLPCAPAGTLRIGTDRTRARSAASAVPFTLESEASLQAASLASERGLPFGPVAGQRLVSSSMLGSISAPRATVQPFSPAVSVVPVTSTFPSRFVSTRRSVGGAPAANAEGAASEGVASSVPDTASTAIARRAGRVRDGLVERVGTVRPFGGERGQH